MSVSNVHVCVVHRHQAVEVPHQTLEVYGGCLIAVGAVRMRGAVRGPSVQLNSPLPGTVVLLYM